MTKYILPWIPEVLEKSLYEGKKLLLIFMYIFFQNVLFYVLSDDAAWVQTNLGNVTYYIGADQPWEDHHHLTSKQIRIGKWNHAISITDVQGRQNIN